MSNPTEAWPKAVKKAPRSNYKFVDYLYGIANDLPNVPALAGATPSAAQIKTMADNLTQANAKAKHGGPAATAARDALRLQAEEMVDQLVWYTRTAIRAAAPDAATARSMILAAGLSVQLPSSAVKPPFAAKNGEVSGTAVLVVRAVADVAVYLWEMSADQKSWGSLPQTFKATTTVTGLTPGQTYYFRFRSQTRTGGVSNESQVVSLFVH